MAQQIVGSTVATVRQARGQRQVELAELAGMSQGLLSKVESDATEIDVERVRGLASALNVTVGLLGSGLDEVIAGCTHFRKRASLRVSDSTQVRAELALRAHVFSRLRHLTTTESAMIRRETPTEDGYLSASEIARNVRSDLGVQPGPIVDLFGVIESAGALLSTVHDEELAFDAASVWAAGGGGFVAMLLNTARPTDRMRFSTAHELGHAVMHAGPSVTAEAEADEFASEFLMPATDIQEELRGLTFSRLGSLKSKWRVSMAAIVRRAFDVGAIPERRYRSLSIELSKAGYRKNEPLALMPEAPKLAATMLERAVRAGASLERIVDETGLVDVAELLSITGYTTSEAS
jgi:transcriptional regulator with XRE-family HTH domain